MLSFTENKKRDIKLQEKEEQAAVKKPAWVDKHTNGLQVGISKESRLRKLMKAEDETSIEGNEFSKRL